MSTQHNRAVVERLDALVGATDLDALDYLCTPEMVNHSLAPNRSVGLAGTRECLTEAARRLGDADWSSLRVIADGDFVVQHGVRGGSWRGGAMFGYDAQPGEYSHEVAFIYRLADGRIAERWAVRDDLTMLRQTRRDRLGTPR